MAAANLPNIDTINAMHANVETLSKKPTQNTLSIYINRHLSNPDSHLRYIR